MPRFSSTEHELGGVNWHFSNGIQLPDLRHLALSKLTRFCQSDVWTKQDIVLDVLKFIRDIRDLQKNCVLRVLLFSLCCCTAVLLVGIERGGRNGPLREPSSLPTSRCRQLFNPPSSQPRSPFLGVGQRDGVASMPKGVSRGPVLDSPLGMPCMRAASLSVSGLAPSLTLWAPLNWAAALVALAQKPISPVAAKHEARPLWVECSRPPRS
jgi:hypothetical protein